MKPLFSSSVVPWIPAFAGMTVRISLLFCAGLLLTACSNPNAAPRNLNMVVSVSTDGHYAIATNTNKQAVLWNLYNHSHQIISSDANIYSAYFIKNTNDFMYQNDATNEVIVETTGRAIVKQFNPGFPTYGEAATSNLNNYFLVDVNDQLFAINAQGQKQQMLWHYCDENDPTIPSGVPYTCGSFMGDGKLFNLTLSSDNKHLVTSGFEEFYVWDVNSRKLLFHSYKNDAQTVSAINPDGKYLVTGDIMSRGVQYNFTTGNHKEFFYDPHFTPDQINNFVQGSFEILAIKFIANNELLVINNGTPQSFNYATLYNIQNFDWTKYDQPSIKYLPLIPNAATDFNYQKTWPLTSDQFSRDQAIDTSPQAHILVMAMDRANGIIVYHYDPKTQTLTRDWAGVVKPWWQLW